jgi:hypothetical protein
VAADDWLRPSDTVFKWSHVDETLGAAAASIVSLELQAFLLTFCDEMHPREITIRRIKDEAQNVLVTGAGRFDSIDTARNRELTFDGDGMNSWLIEARPQLTPLDQAAAAGLSALIECLAYEILTLAGDAANEHPATNGTAITRIAYCPADDLHRFDEMISATVVVRECHVRQAVAGDEELCAVFPCRARLGESARSGSFSAADETQPLEVSSSVASARVASSGASTSVAGADAPRSGGGAPLRGDLPSASRFEGGSSSSGAAARASWTLNAGAGIGAAQGASIDVRARFKRVASSGQRAAGFGQPPGSFAVDGVFSFVPPLLKLDAMDKPLAFPLPAFHRDKLKEHAELRRLGYFVPSSRLSFGSGNWAPFVEAIVPEMLQGLGVDQAASHVRTKLRGLLLCSASGPVTDTAPAASGVFGTLEVSFPSARVGGGLRLRHAGDESKELAPRDDSQARRRCHYAAYYSLCEREMLPLRSGYWLPLLYDLVSIESEGVEDVLEPSCHAATQLGRFARSWAEHSAGPRKLCYFLEHRTACWALLRGKDAALAKALAAAEDGTGKAFEMRLVHIDAREAEDGGYSFTPTWRDGPAQPPPAIAQEMRSGGIQFWQEEVVQGHDYFSSRHYNDYTPRLPLHACDAIVLWPCCARLEIFSARRGLSIAVSALSSVLTQEARGGQPTEDEFFGFGSSLELLTATIRLVRKKGPNGLPLHSGQCLSTAAARIPSIFTFPSGADGTA